jgi:hypothetical protein
MLPAGAATLMVVVFAAVELGGYTPLSVHPHNLAEATALGNAAETVRRLALGDNPYRMETVRGVIIGSDPIRLTAVEGAVYSKRPELVRLLEIRGVLVEAETRYRLACLARDIGATDIFEYLVRDHEVGCQPGAVRAEIVQRPLPADAS